MLLAELVEAWLVDRRIAKPSAHTVKAYRADVAQISIRLAAVHQVDRAEMTTAQVSVPALRAAVADLADSHSPASVARCMSTWRSLCRFGKPHVSQPGDVHLPIAIPASVGELNHRRFPCGYPGDCDDAPPQE